MQHDILVGIEHPIAAWFVLEKLSQARGRVSCLSDDRHSGLALSNQVEAMLKQRESIGSVSTAEALRHLTIVEACVEADADTQDQEHGGAALFLFLRGADIARLRRDPSRGLAYRSLARTLRARFGPLRQVHVIADIFDLAGDQSVDRAVEGVEQALISAFPAGSDFRMHCLGPYVGEPGVKLGPGQFGASPVEALVDQVIDVVFDVKRRSSEYFSRYPMRLHVKDCGSVRIMSMASAATYLAQAEYATQPGRHLAFGTQTCLLPDLLNCIARATQTDIQGIASDHSDGVDRASSIVSDGLRQIVQRCQIGIEDIRSAGLNLHELTAEAIDLSIHVGRMVKVRDAEGNSRQQPFAALPGLKVKQTAKPALRYLRYGTGPDALLIVNAFGLSLDFWQLLAGSLQDRFTLIALDKRDAADDETCIARTYYSADNYADDYVSDVAEVLRSEGVDRCHVVSWCSGAKLAIELADALPRSIRSLSLVAPSFAGIEATQGCDSAYEKNLHTMCKIVRQMPKSAGNMASSMTAIMRKSSNDLDRFHPDAKDAVDVFELPDAHHLPLLYRPFSSAQNMIEFSQQLLHFRAHDITPRLGNETLGVPVMLVTGRTDTTTSALRAKEICGRLRNIVGFEIEGSSHYLIHQNYRIVADLVRAFTTEGMNMAYSNPRVERSAFQQIEEAVTGEI